MFSVFLTNFYVTILSSSSVKSFYHTFLIFICPDVLCLYHCFCLFRKCILFPLTEVVNKLYYISIGSNKNTNAGSGMH